MGITKSLILSFLLILLCINTYGQDQAIDFQQEYEKAKAFYREGRYGLAQDSFEKLTQENDQNPYSIYSSFYYALSAYHQGYLALARDMLLQIRVRYPGWPQMEEVNYWLAIVYFEYGNPELALEAANQIDPERSLQMQRFYLQKITGLDTLINLLESYPESYPIAEQTAYLITQQNFLERDLDLLDSLADKFQLPFLSDKDRQELGPKDKYSVSIMFPFLAKELKPNLSSKVNQFVLDLYQGIMLAGDSLNKAGSPIDFTLFDTERDTSVIKKFFNDNRLRKSDLIIGPLYNTEIMDSFAIKNRVNIVHPFYKDHKLVQENPYFLTYSTLPEDVGLKAAELVLSDTTLKYGIVFYGQNERDSIMANTFIEEVDSSHFEVLLRKRILLGEERQALMALTGGAVVNKIAMEEIEILPYDSLDLIYIASNNPGGSIYSTILTGVEARPDTVQVIGSRNWIEDNVASKDLLGRLDITMTAYDFINFSDSSYIDFSNKYLNRYGTLPSKFSAIGYDMMMFFGSSMQKYGKFFQLGLREEGYIPGSISSGYDYSRSNSNAVVPVIKWEDGKVIIISQSAANLKSTKDESEEQQK